MKPVFHALAALMWILMMSGCAASSKYEEQMDAEDDPFVMPDSKPQIHGSMSMSVGTGRGYGGYEHPLDDARTYPRAVDGWGPGFISP